jgi:acyl-CoA thioesterase
LQSSFLRRASAGPAVFTLKDLKLGRRTSTIQATLTQGSEQVAIVSYVTQSNISAESGPSAPTHWALSPPPYPVDISKLKQDVDEHWTRVTERPFARFPKTIAHINFYLPRKGQLEMSIGDQFLQFADGGRFTMDSLGYAADLVQQVAESYFGEERARHPRAVSLGAHWYPTVVLNLEIKKVLPPDGVDFLFVRARAKQIKNGRADLEVVILDEDGELVALSHHVALILSSKRNTGKRGAKKDGGETKL